jgi:hypothetical protein
MHASRVADCTEQLVEAEFGHEALMQPLPRVDRTFAVPATPLLQAKQAFPDVPVNAAKLS